MNLCFLIGKIVSPIQFEFILNSTHISIAIFNIALLNDSKVTVKGYDEIADYCYSTLEEGMIIGAQGSINSKTEVILEAIEIQTE